jgi:hypothetical protein
MNEGKNLPQDNNSPETSPNDTEISEKDLEQIAGGFTPVPIPESKFSKVKDSLTQVKLNPNNLGAIVKGEGQQ